MLKRIIVVLIIFISVVLGAIWFYNQQHQLKDTLQVATGALVIIAIFYASLTFEYNFKKNLNEAKKSLNLLTFTTCSEWSKKDMLEFQIVLDNFNEKYQHLEHKDYYDKLHEPENSEVRKAFACIFNYFEAISLAIYQNLIEEKFTKSFLFEVYCDYFQTYQKHIKYRSERRKVKELWAKYLALSEKWLKEGLSNKTRKSYRIFIPYLKIEIMITNVGDKV